MCCDKCPKYDECEAKNKLNEECCPQCTDYDYCWGSDNHDDIEGDFEDNGKKFRGYQDHY